MKKISIAVFVMYIILTCPWLTVGSKGYFSVCASQDDESLALDEDKLIKKAVEDFYIRGIEIRDFELIKKICIPEAELMSAGRDGTLHLTSLDKWSKNLIPIIPLSKSSITVSQRSTERVEQLRLRFFSLLTPNERLLTFSTC